MRYLHAEILKDSINPLIRSRLNARPANRLFKVSARKAGG